MKKKIAWITDSTASISPELAKKYNINIVCLDIIFGENAYKEHTDVNSKNFFSTIEKETEHPKTSQPSTGEFIQLYEKLSEEYDMAISVHVSSKLSGTLNNAHIASNMVDFPVLFVDSQASSYLLFYLLLEGQKKVEEGFTPEEVVNYLNEIKENCRAYILVPQLDFLSRSGRVSGMKLLMGTMLKLKLLLRLHDGEIQFFQKFRSVKKCKDALFSTFNKEYNDKKNYYVDIVHADNKTEALQWKEELSLKYPKLNFRISDFGPTISTHAGPQSIGLVWLSV